MPEKKSIDTNSLLLLLEIVFKNNEDSGFDIRFLGVKNIQQYMLQKSFEITTEKRARCISCKKKIAKYQWVIFTNEWDSDKTPEVFHLNCCKKIFKIVKYFFTGHDVPEQTLSQFKNLVVNP